MRKYFLVYQKFLEWTIHRPVVVLSWLRCLQQSEPKKDIFFPRVARQTGRAAWRLLLFACFRRLSQDRYGRQIKAVVRAAYKMTKLKFSARFFTVDGWRCGIVISYGGNRGCSKADPPPQSVSVVRWECFLLNSESPIHWLRRRSGAGFCMS